MALDTIIIQDKVTQKFGDDVTAFGMQRDIFNFEVAPNRIHEVIDFLKNDADLNFHFLTDLTVVHYTELDENHQFSVVYQLHNWVENVRLRVRTFVPASLQIATITDLFLTANWMEREAYDFYGVIFKGHPQLKRILNMDEMVSFPMRKEFPMEDQGRTDKDDRFFGRVPVNCN
jgi:NADH-quinone oxidoreductase subunit C